MPKKKGLGGMLDGALDTIGLGDDKKSKSRGRKGGSSKKTKGSKKTSQK